MRSARLIQPRSCPTARCRAVDTNFDGAIDSDELHEALQQLNIKTSKEETIAIFEAVIAGAAVEASSSVTGAKPEDLESLSMSLFTNLIADLRAFDEVDKEGARRLSRDGASAALTSLGVSHAGFDAMLSSAGLGQTLSRADFVRVIRVSPEAYGGCATCAWNLFEETAALAKGSLECSHFFPLEHQHTPLWWMSLTLPPLTLPPPRAPWFDTAPRRRAEPETPTAWPGVVRVRRRRCAQLDVQKEAAARKGGELECVSACVNGTAFLILRCMVSLFTCVDASE